MIRRLSQIFIYLLKFIILTLNHNFNYFDLLDILILTRNVHNCPKIYLKNVKIATATLSKTSLEQIEKLRKELI